MVEPIFAFDVDEDGRAVSLDEEEAKKATAKEKGYRWIHLELDDPSLEQWLAENLPATPGAALLQAETRPRCDRYRDGYIVNLRAVNLNPGADTDDMVAVRLWVVNGLVISVRRRKIMALDAIRAEAAEGNAPGSIGALLVELLGGLTDRMESVSLDLVEKTDEIEEQSLEKDYGYESDLVSLRISSAKLRRYIGPQREAIHRLAASEGSLLSDNAKISIREIANRVTRIVEELDSLRERHSALQDHIDADRSESISRNGYILTVVAAIFLPLGFLTGLLGVNVAGIPGAEWPYAFAGLCFASVIIGLGLYGTFKAMKWI